MFSLCQKVSIYSLDWFLNMLVSSFKSSKRSSTLEVQINEHNCFTYSLFSVLRHYITQMYLLSLEIKFVNTDATFSVSLPLSREPRWLAILSTMHVAFHTHNQICTMDNALVSLRNGVPHGAVMIQCYAPYAIIHI